MACRVTCTPGSTSERSTSLRRPFIHAIEGHHPFLQAPVIVHSLFLKKPERIEALGLVLLLALLLWRLVERALRIHRIFPCHFLRSR